MALTLADLRSQVRSQTQTTASELPDSDVDAWLQQAYNRTIAFENDWPFFEEQWSMTLPAGSASVALPVTPYRLRSNGIASLFMGGKRLEMVDHALGETMDGYFPGSSDPPYFSVWGDKVYFWPAPSADTDQDFSIRGHRRPTDWIGAGAASEPDCDEALHAVLVPYAVALAYAQQEDPELEAQYMGRWERDVAVAHASIMDPAHHEPLRLGPRFVTPIGGTRRRSVGVGTSWRISP